MPCEAVIGSTVRPPSPARPTPRLHMPGEPSRAKCHNFRKLRCLTPSSKEPVSLPPRGPQEPCSVIAPLKVKHAWPTLALSGRPWGISGLLPPGPQFRGADQRCTLAWHGSPAEELRAGHSAGPRRPVAQATRSAGPRGPGEMPQPEEEGCPVRDTGAAPQGSGL